MPRFVSTRILGGLLAALGCAFAALTLFVARRPLPPRVTTEVENRLRDVPGGWRYDLASVLRPFGSFPVVVALSLLGGALLLWRWRRPDLAAVFVVAPLLAGLAEVALRSQIDRAVSRTAALEGAFGYGYPSGHVTGTTALAAVAVLGALELSDRRVVRGFWIAVALLLISTVAVSSVVGGAHHSQDVLGGVMLGASATLAVSIAVWWRQLAFSRWPTRSA
jgi:membrane-associated phospholipid phosphatase